MINSLKEKYPFLMREIESINYAWGWPGMLDSLEFIGNRLTQYEGTKVGDEYRVFIEEMGELVQEMPLNSSIV